MDKKYKNLFIVLLIISGIMLYVLYSNRDFVWRQLVRKPFYNQQPQLSNSLLKYQYQVYNADKKLITEELFDAIDFFDPDIIKVEKDNLFGLIDENGNYILKPEYASIQRIYTNKQDKWFLVRKKTITKTYRDYIFDSNGKELYSAEGINYENPYFLVFEKNNGWTILDDNFKQVLNQTFENYPQIVNNKYIIVYGKNSSKVIDFSGNEIIPYGYYKSIYNICNDKNNKNYFSVLYNKNKGIVDDRNKIIVPPIFDEVIYLYNKDGDITFWGEKQEYQSTEKSVESFKRKSHKNKRKHEKEKAILKLANFDVNGKLIENPDKENYKNHFGFYFSLGNYRQKVQDIKSLGFPDRKIIPVGIKEQDKNNKNEPEILTLEEINTYISNLYFVKNNNENTPPASHTESTVTADFNQMPPKIHEDEILKPKFIPAPSKQEKHKTVYKSDFGSSKINGNFTKLTCISKPRFCEISPNGLSVKYCDRESFYVANTKRAYGKYYFEVYIKNNLAVQWISKDTKFSLIHSPTYKTKEDAKEYCDWHINNSNLLAFSEYGFKNKDIAGIAIDLDNGRMYIQINGEWKNNPYAPNDGIKIDKEKSYYLAFSVAGYNETLTVNFGRQPFKYKMPDGYKTLNYKDKVILPKSEHFPEKRYGCFDIE